MSAFSENSLTIILSGPKTADAKVFFGNNKIGYIQRIELTCSADTFLPIISLTFPMISFSQETYEINDNDIVIVVGNILRNNLETYISQTVTMSLGNKVLGAINQLKFIADVSQEYHNLTLYYSTFVNDLYERAIKPIENIEWVNIKTQE